MQENLTSREREIFNLLLDGVSPKEIAYKLHVSSKAVDYHRGNLYGKLGVHSIQELFAKYSQDHLKADSVNSASIEPETVPTVNKAPKKRLWLLISAGALILAVLVFLSWLFFIKPKAPLVSAEKLFEIILADNAPWGWMQYYYPAGFTNMRLTEGDRYTFTYTFTSDADFSTLFVFIVDKTAESDNFFRFLCPHIAMKHEGQANIEYSGSVTLHVLKTASSKDPFANLIGIETNPYEASQPTLTFTRFEITKDNKPASETPSPSLAAAENSFSLVFSPHQTGWYSYVYPPAFHNTKITEGDIYTVSCSFTSDVDLEAFQVDLYDDSKLVWESLSPSVALVRDGKTNIEYSGTVTLIAYQTATDTSPPSNLLRLDAYTLICDQRPTLTFTKLEVTKMN